VTLTPDQGAARTVEQAESRFLYSAAARAADRAGGATELIASICQIGSFGLSRPAHVPHSLIKRALPMSEQKPTLGFPLLYSGQAQKEVTHNEALVLADALVQLVVQAVAPAAIPPSPEPGQCWIVGVGAGDAWAGHDNAIACWTGGGWRFVASSAGMCAWSLADSLPARRETNVWTLGRLEAATLRIGGDQVVGARQPAIAEATGGPVADAEVRIAVAAVLGVLRAHGLIAA